MSNNCRNMASIVSAERIHKEQEISKQVRSKRSPTPIRKPRKGDDWPEHTCPDVDGKVCLHKEPGKLSWARPLGEYITLHSVKVKVDQQPPTMAITNETDPYFMTSTKNIWNSPIGDKIMRYLDIETILLLKTIHTNWRTAAEAYMRKNTMESKSDGSTSTRSTARGGGTPPSN